MNFSCMFGNHDYETIASCEVVCENTNKLYNFIGLSSINDKNDNRVAIVKKCKRCNYIYSYLTNVRNKIEIDIDYLKIKCPSIKKQIEDYECSKSNTCFK